MIYTYFECLTSVYGIIPVLNFLHKVVDSAKFCADEHVARSKCSNKLNENVLLAGQTTAEIILKNLVGMCK